MASTGNVHAKKKNLVKGIQMILCTLGNLVLGLPIHFCSALTMAYFIIILILSKSKIGYKSIATIPEDRRVGFIQVTVGRSSASVCACVCELI